MSKTSRILTLISIVLFSLGIAGYMVGLVFDAKGFAEVATYIYLAATLCETVGFILLIIRFAKYGMPKVEERYVYQQPKVQKVKTVDVKPVEETQEQKLFKQYEGLYKEGLITKEELEAKRKELLNK